MLRPSAPRHRSLLVHEPPGAARPPRRGLLDHAAWAGAIAVLLLAAIVTLALPSPHFALIPAAFGLLWAHFNRFGMRSAALSSGCLGATIAFLYYDLPYIPV